MHGSSVAMFAYVEGSDGRRHENLPALQLSDMRGKESARRAEAELRRHEARWMV